ncbi:ABC transporter ATP-binding protein [Myxococcota bacterium]|nr:ABC transporter ATP-binding protein [Myxococcota bacterium]
MSARMSPSLCQGLVVSGLTAGHRPRTPVVHDVSFEAPRGRVTALLGPNGAGKSTLLKSVLGLLPHEGHLRLGDTDLGALAPRDRARHLAYVPQRTLLTARLSVRAVVELGRFVHRGPLGSLQRADHRAVDAAMEVARVAELRDRPFPELSGGEQQRVVLARALATGARCLLLDEPTAALDVRQVLHLHEALARLAEDDHTIVVVLHDLAEARQHAHHAVLLHEGRLHARGPVDRIIAPRTVREVYGVDLVEGAGLGWRIPGVGQ